MNCLKNSVDAHFLTAYRRQLLRKVYNQYNFTEHVMITVEYIRLETWRPAHGAPRHSLDVS